MSSTNDGTIWYASAIVCVVFFIFFFMSGIVYTSLFVDPTYNKVVHGHLENAYWSSDPATMRTEIIAAKDGMMALGLTPDTYGAFWDFQKTPDRRMDWQYKHIDSIITRIDEWQAWERNQSVGTSSQQMQDVNTQKLNNVRSFIKEGGWSDDIAHDAYQIQYNPFFFVCNIWILLFLGITGLISLFIACMKD